MSRPKSKSESAKYWRVPELRNLELLHAKYKGRSFPRRINEGFEISLIENGAQFVNTRGGTSLASRGSIVVINPSEAYSVKAADGTGWTCRSFYPTANSVRDAALGARARTAAIPFFPQSTIEDAGLAAIIRHLHLLLGSSASTLAQESYSIWAATQLVLRHAAHPPIVRPPGREHKAVGRVMEYINAHYADDLSLDEIASIANLSPFHLVRVFRLQVGLPPHAYLTQVRINKAKLLLNLGQPIAETAVDTGFVDQSHFSRHFKRILGMTPGQFAKTARLYKID